MAFVLYIVSYLFTTAFRTKRQSDRRGGFMGQVIEPRTCGVCSGEVGDIARVQLYARGHLLPVIQEFGGSDVPWSIPIFPCYSGLVTGEHLLICDYCNLFE